MFHVQLKESESRRSWSVHPYFPFPFPFLTKILTNLGWHKPLNSSDIEHTEVFLLEKLQLFQL